MKSLVRLFDVVMCILLVSGAMVAKVSTVSSERKFNRRITRENFLVVLFFEEERDMDKKEKRNVDLLERVFVETSRTPLYREGDVEFSKINVAKKSASDLDDQYGVKALPTFILFKDGAPVKDKSGSIAKLTGFSTKKTLKQFINHYLKDDIEDYIEDRHDRLKRRSEERSYRYPGYGYGGFGWGYPYYGYGYYPWYGSGYYGGGFGLGFGF